MPHLCSISQSHRGHFCGRAKDVGSGLTVGMCMRTIAIEQGLLVLGWFSHLHITRLLLVCQPFLCPFRPFPLPLPSAFPSPTVCGTVTRNLRKTTRAFAWSKDL